MNCLYVFMYKMDGKDARQTILCFLFEILNLKMGVICVCVCVFGVGDDS